MVKVASQRKYLFNKQYWNNQSTCKNNFTDIISSQFLPWGNYKIKFQVDQRLNIKHKRLKRNYPYIIILRKISQKRQHWQLMKEDFINVAQVISKRADGTKSRGSYHCDQRLSSPECVTVTQQCCCFPDGDTRFSHSYP